jgi:WhiB family redox-sensing transcriptional regulator
MGPLEALMAGKDLPTVAEIVHPPPWHTDAECRRHPELTWFPTLSYQAAPAKRVCAACPVRVECLAYAISKSDLDGIWGGLSAKERRRLRQSVA